MAGFKKLTPFRFWCQKVLPLVYDESLSYEELLCKVVAYLNGVIEDVNQIPEYIQSLISEEQLKAIFSELLDDLREQIVADNEGEKTTASKDHEAGDLVWLNGKLAVITRDILAGTEYIEKTGSVGITGNFVYTTVNEETRARYSSDNMRLTIHGYVDPNTQIVTRGDYHVYDGARQAIDIIEV